MNAFSPQRLRAARVKRGLTQAELARVLEVTERNISRWELGQNTPRADTIAALAKALHVRESHFFAENGDEAA